MGKSTAINRALALLGCSIGGFRTGFGPDRGEINCRLYLWDASLPAVYSEEYAVAQFAAGKPAVYPQRFNELGCAALRQGVERGSRLLLMDECGFLERQALEFQQAVLSALDGTLPVLGVVRKKGDGWLDTIRTHPKVTLWTVTENNRDALPRQIAALLGPAVSK